MIFIIAYLEHACLSDLLISEESCIIVQRESHSLVAFGLVLQSLVAFGLVVFSSLWSCL